MGGFPGAQVFCLMFDRGILTLRWRTRALSYGHAGRRTPRGAPIVQRERGSKISAYCARGCYAGRQGKMYFGGLLGTEMSGDHIGYSLEVALPKRLDLLVHQLSLHPREVRVVQLRRPRPRPRPSSSFSSR